MPPSRVSKAKRRDNHIRGVPSVSIRSRPSTHDNLTYTIIDHFQRYNPYGITPLANVVLPLDPTTLVQCSVVSCRIGGRRRGRLFASGWVRNCPSALAAQIQQAGETILSNCPISMQDTVEHYNGYLTNKLKEQFPHIRVISTRDSFNFQSQVWSKYTRPVYNGVHLLWHIRDRVNDGLGGHIQDESSGRHTWYPVISSNHAPMVLKIPPGSTSRPTEQIAPITFVHASLDTPTRYDTHLASHPPDQTQHLSEQMVYGVTGQAVALECNNSDNVDTPTYTSSRRPTDPAGDISASDTDTDPLVLPPASSIPSAALGLEEPMSDQDADAPGSPDPQPTEHPRSIPVSPPTHQAEQTHLSSTSRPAVPACASPASGGSLSDAISGQDTSVVNDTPLIMLRAPLTPPSSAGSAVEEFDPVPIFQPHADGEAFMGASSPCVSPWLRSAKMLFE